MSRLIRMDASGHSTLAEWTVEEGYDDAVEQFRRQLEEGWIAVRDEGEGRADGGEVQRMIEQRLGL